jgi:ribosomal-protein-alanine N-acetyltransferase
VNTTASQADLCFRPLEEAHAREILEWRYEPPYDTYNLGGDAQEIVEYMLTPEYRYHAILSQAGELLAFCCFGEDAQVPGGDYSAEALDIGLGVRPDLTGQGQGSRYVQAVLDFARRTWSPRAVRVTIAEFNTPAQKVWQKAGLERVQRFKSTHSGRPFLIFVYGM